MQRHESPGRSADCEPLTEIRRQGSPARHMMLSSRTIGVHRTPQCRSESRHCHLMRPQKHPSGPLASRMSDHGRNDTTKVVELARLFSTSNPLKTGCFARFAFGHLNSDLEKSIATIINHCRHGDYFKNRESHALPSCPLIHPRIQLHCSRDSIRRISEQ